MPARKPAATATPAAAADDIDLDQALGELDLSPQVVRFGGQAYAVRRDLTLLDKQAYWARAGSADDAGAMAILLGDEQRGSELNEHVAGLPHAQMDLVLKRMMIVAGLMNDNGTVQGSAEGEAGAS